MNCVVVKNFIQIFLTVAVQKSNISPQKRLQTPYAERLAVRNQQIADFQSIVVKNISLSSAKHYCSDLFFCFSQVTLLWGCLQ